MSLHRIALALGALFIVGVFVAGAAAGKAWGRASAMAALQSEQHERMRGLDEDLLALQRRLDRYGEAQRQLAENALDCRVATAERHSGKRLELALRQTAP